MTLSLSDILNGIPDFVPDNQEIKIFVAKAEMIHKLAATNQKDTVLTVIKAKLATANKLEDISSKSWNEIKNNIKNKYCETLSFETAQERLLLIKQDREESLESYANRVKCLLDAMNSASTNENPVIQTAHWNMNEGLAARKFKQNIADEKLRLLALASDHNNLLDAIMYVTEKQELLISSNIEKTKMPNISIEKTPDSDVQNDDNESFDEEYNTSSDKSEAEEVYQESDDHFEEQNSEEFTTEDTEEGDKAEEIQIYNETL